MKDEFYKTHNLGLITTPLRNIPFDSQVPPTVAGLIAAIENKYKINASNIRFLYRKSRNGPLAKIDDDMLRFYCNEDIFLMQVRK